MISSHWHDMATISLSLVWIWVWQITNHDMHWQYLKFVCSFYGYFDLTTCMSWNNNNNNNFIHSFTLIFTTYWIAVNQDKLQKNLCTKSSQNMIHGLTKLIMLISFIHMDSLTLSHLSIYLLIRLNNVEPKLSKSLVNIEIWKLTCSAM